MTQYRLQDSKGIRLIKPVSSVLATCFLLVSVNTFSETFKCEQNGITIYSDRPCTNPKPLQLPKYKPPEKKTGHDALSTREKYHQLNFKLEAARKQRAIKRKIELLKLQIDETEHMREVTLKQLREDIETLDFESDDIDDVVNAEDQEQDLNEKIREVDRKFAQQLDDLQAEMNALQTQMQRMNPDQ